MLIVAWLSPGCTARYLFPAEEEYLEWFKNAGFTDVKLERINPTWYNGDRSHGLIMGCSVVGTKPATVSSPPRPATTSDSPGEGETEERASEMAYRVIMALPRFLLGTIASLYYVYIPIHMYVKNVVWVENPALVLSTAVVSVVVLLTALKR